MFENVIRVHRLSHYLTIWWLCSLLESSEGMEYWHVMKWYSPIIFRRLLCYVISNTLLIWREVMRQSVYPTNLELRLSFRRITIKYRRVNRSWLWDQDEKFFVSHFEIYVVELLQLSNGFNRLENCLDAEMLFYLFVNTFLSNFEINTIQ